MVMLSAKYMLNAKHSQALFLLSVKYRDNVEERTWPRKTKMRMRWLWGARAERPAAISSALSNARKSLARPPRLDGRKNDQAMKDPVRSYDKQGDDGVPWLRASLDL